MREYIDIYEMNDKELRALRRKLKLRIERRRKVFMSVVTLMLTVGLVLFSVLSYNTLKISANNGFKYYTQVVVESGETLWDIADEYIDYGHYKDKGSYIAEVRSINHLSEDCLITAGQLLVVPYYSDEFK